jgi:hypothetical protein
MCLFWNVFLPILATVDLWTIFVRVHRLDWSFLLEGDLKSTFLTQILTVELGWLCAWHRWPIFRVVHLFEPFEKLDLTLHNGFVGNRRYRIFKLLATFILVRTDHVLQVYIRFLLHLALQPLLTLQLSLSHKFWVLLLLIRQFFSWKRSISIFAVWKLFHIWKLIEVCFLWISGIQILPHCRTPIRTVILG